MAKYITPAVTPLKEDGTLDLKGLDLLVEHLVAGGVDGILFLGSIGEFFSLSVEAKKQLIREACRRVAHRVPVMIGISAMVMEECFDLARTAADAGADRVIAVPPYYFPLRQPRIECFYSALADGVALPLYLYNFPDRTGYSIDAETVLRLRQKHGNIVGIKDTLSGVDHTREIIRLVKGPYPDFEVYSGFDDNFARNVLSGGDGCIAGLSNLAPEITSAWARAVNAGDWKTSAAFQQKIDRLMAIYGVGTPFVPYIKAAMVLRKIGIGPAATFPLPVPDSGQTALLQKILEEEGLLP